MDIPRKLREELNALSKEVFGVSSKWKTMLDDGQRQLITRKTTEVVPGKDGAADTTKEVDVPVLTPYGAKQSTTKYYTLEEIHNLLLTYKTQLDNFKALAKKQEEEKAAKLAVDQALSQVKEAAQGSAVV